jgi:hypothetical protein
MVSFGRIPTLLLSVEQGRALCCVLLAQRTRPIFLEVSIHLHLPGNRSNPSMRGGDLSSLKDRDVSMASDLPLEALLAAASPSGYESERR